MRLGIHRVQGLSMTPNFLHDDYVLTFRWRFSRFRVGDVVVVRHPSLGTIIKRIAQMDDRGRLLLAGDHPASTDSATLGWQSPERLLGAVWWRVTSKRFS